MHLTVAKACLKHGKHLCTSSYISPGMRELDAEFKKKGLISLNQCGLDPGIDIMSTMKVKDDSKALGHKIVSYTSWCGAVADVEHCDNPLGYKFSWNPGAAIKASLTPAVYMQDGKKITDTAALRHALELDDFHVALQLEGYANRDSTVFMEEFGMQDCPTFIRGTLRFKGFCAIVQAFHDLGLSSDKPVPSHVKTLADLVEPCYQSRGPVPDCAKNIVSQVFYKPSDKVLERCYKLLASIDLSEYKTKKLEKHCKGIVDSFKFLGLFDEKQTAVTITANGKPRSYLDTFGDVLKHHLTLPDDEHDLVIMRHVFKIQDQQGQEYQKTSTMVVAGKSIAEGGPTGVAKTVGVTAAIGTRMILEGKIPQRGVLSPIYPEIYGPILHELERRGVRMVEEGGPVIAKL